MKKIIIGLVFGLLFTSIFSYIIVRVFFIPPQIEQFRDIESWETAFVIPLEQEMKNQVKLDSISAYEDAKVASKRVPIPTKWLRLGRIPGNGAWVPMVKVITVDRTSVARLWTNDQIPGTSSIQAPLTLESADSIGFKAPFNCTAFVPEELTARFLYYYQIKSLQQILDEEVRNKIQNVGISFCTQFSMDKLREMKPELNYEVRSKVIPFFEEKGIRITTLGLAGYYQYNNIEVQNSIDKVFIAQQEKNVEAALLSAMDFKERVKKDEGEAEANKIREEAQGKRDAKVIEAEGKALSMKHVMNALRQAQQSPMFLAVKGLEIELNRIEKWDGSVPLTILDETSPLPLLSLSTNQ